MEERRTRYLKNTIWIERKSGNEMRLVRRDEDGSLWFEGYDRPFSEVEVIWSGRRLS